MFHARIRVIQHSEMFTLAWLRFYYFHATMSSYDIEYINIVLEFDKKIVYEFVSAP